MPAIFKLAQAVFIGSLLLLSFANINAAQAETRVIQNPKLGGYYLDRCYRFGQNCNKPAADAYCRSIGFSRSTDFHWTYLSPTRTLGDHRVCNGSGCGSFRYVTCTRDAAQARTRVIRNPKLGGYYLDRCYRFGQNCNKPAADAYCRSIGFSRSTDFHWTYLSPTRTLGDHRVCKGSGCGSFRYVTCTR